MNPTYRENWWSHRSLKFDDDKQWSIDPFEIVRQETKLYYTKHTFFPSSETSRDRLKYFSNFVFGADSKVKLFWDSLIILYSIFLSFVIPYSISFFQDFSLKFYLFSSIFFSLDMIITLNTAYFEEADIIYNRSMIAKNYIKTDFFIDLLSAFPFELMFLEVLDMDFQGPQYFASQSEYLRFLLLLKLLKLHKVSRFIYQVQSHYSQLWVYTTIKIFNYFLIAVFPAHWATCAFNFLYCYSLYTHIYWPSLIYQDTHRYLSLLERVVQTMTSVGYGDLVTKTSYERFFSIIFMSFTSGLLGFFVGAIHETIEKSSAVSNYFRKVLQDFKVFTEKHRVPKSLQYRVRYYLRFLKSSYKKNLFREEDIIQILSTPLKEQIFLHTRGFILMSLPQFREMSTGIIKALGFNLIIKFYSPGDLIIRENEKSYDVYFILKGSLHVIHENSNTIFAKLKKNNYFGEIAFFSEKRRTASVVSKNFSEVYSLSRYSLDKVIKNLPRDREVFNTLIRNLKTYGLAYLKISCYLCRQTGHVARDCRKYLCAPDISAISEKCRRRREEKHSSRFARPDRLTNYLGDYSLLRTKGRTFEPKEKFREKKFLSHRVFEYQHSLKGFLSENRVFSLIDKIGNKKDDSDSDNSVKDYLHFTLTRGKNTLGRLPISLNSYK